MIIIGRPSGETTLNGMEYLMNEDNTDYRFFKDRREAMDFLNSSLIEPVTDDELQDAFMFLDTETDFENPEVFKKD
jgi:hypothetical protein